MMTTRNNIVLWSIAAILLQLCEGSPVFVPQFLSGGTGRNIRHLPCVSRRTGEQGVCMFAFTCAKANGTHLGTCIDRFYFGSCCKIEDPSAAIDASFHHGNEIDHENTSPAKPFITSSSTTSTTQAVESNDIPGNVDNKFKTRPTKRPTEVTTQSTRLSTFQTVQNASEQRYTTLAPTTSKVVTPRPSSTTSFYLTSTASTVPSSKKPPPPPTTFGQRISTKKPAGSTNYTKKPVSSSTTGATSSSSSVTTSSTKLHRNVTSTTVRPTTITTQRTYPATRFPPRNATTLSSIKTSSYATTTVKNSVPETTFKPVTTKKPVKTTSKRPVTSTTVTKKPTTVASKKPVTTTIASTTVVTKAQTTTVSPLTSVKATTPTIVTSTKKIVTKKPVATATTVVTKKPVATTTVVTKKPVTNSTYVTKKPVTTTTVVTKKPVTTITTTVVTKKPVTTITTSAPKTTTPRPATTLKRTTTTPSPPPTRLTATSVASTKFTTTTSKPTKLPVATTAKPTVAVTKATPKPTTTTTTTTTTVKPTKNATISNEIDAEFEEQTPGLVTWSSFPDESPTKAPPAKEPESSTTSSISSSSISSSSTETESWQPVTTPDGWIIIQSPTTEQQQQQEESEVVVEAKPVSITTGSTTTTTTTATAATSTASATTATTTTTTTTTTSKPTVSSSTTAATVGVQSTTTTSQKVTSTTTQASTTTTTTSYVDTLSTLASVTVAPDFIDVPADPLNMSNFKDVCGRRLFPEPKIVGGDSSTFGKWPWQISLRQWRTSTYLHKCGAALLNENWAITAAHCVQNVLPSDLLLRIGEHDLGNEDEPYGFQERRVQIVASHPNFDPRTFEFDLALMRFYEPVLPFQPNVLPVCIPDDDEGYVGQTAFVTGWGRLYEDGPLPSVLQEVAVPVINNSVCEGMYRNAGYIEHIPHIFICAGWRKGGFDSCEGDSGGPLVIQRKRDKRWVLAGVISWGIGCAEPNQPGVYTRISEFREWINQILQF